MREEEPLRALQDDGKAGKARVCFFSLFSALLASPSLHAQKPEESHSWGGTALRILCTQRGREGTEIRERGKEQAFIECLLRTLLSR